jgi:hypothetical protein
MAYTDYNGASFYKATVMKFNGSSWVNVATLGNPAAQSSDPSLSFSPEGELYVAYSDYNKFYRATVKKFNGTEWLNVGIEGFSEKGTNPILSFGLGGKPLVAYDDKGKDYKVTVMKYDGSNWVSVGTPGFSAGRAFDLSFAISSKGEPYVAYGDDVNSGKASVMKFDGNNWVNVGIAGFSSAAAYHLSLAISSEGIPHVGYNDYFYSGKATVMRFGVFSGINNATFADDILIYPNPANEFITIKDLQDGSTLKIIDNTGNVVYSSIIRNHQTRTINMIDFSNGIYLIHIETENGEVKKSKAMVIK